MSVAHDKIRRTTIMMQSTPVRLGPHFNIKSIIMFISRTYDAQEAACHEGCCDDDENDDRGVGHSAYQVPPLGADWLAQRFVILLIKLFARRDQKGWKRRLLLRHLPDAAMAYLLVAHVGDFFVEEIKRAECMLHSALHKSCPGGS